MPALAPQAVRLTEVVLARRRCSQRKPCLSRTGGRPHARSFRAAAVALRLRHRNRLPKLRVRLAFRSTRGSLFGDRLCRAQSFPTLHRNPTHTDATNVTESYDIARLRRMDAWFWVIHNDQVEEIRDREVALSSCRLRGRQEDQTTRERRYRSDAGRRRANRRAGRYQPVRACASRPDRPRPESRPT